MLPFAFKLKTRQNLDTTSRIGGAPFHVNHDVNFLEIRYF